jgi:tetratricopeptide (TPR) repeat protein
VLLWATVALPADAAEAESVHASGLAALDRGDLSVAVELLEEAVAAAPGQVVYRVALARAYEASELFEKAEAVLRGVLRDHPGHDAAIVALARCHVRRAAYDEAGKLLEPLARQSDAFEVHRLMGEVLRHQGRLEDARRHVLRALAKDETRPGDHRMLGDIYLAQERYALAVDAYRRAVGLGLGSAAVHHRLAIAYHRLGNHLGVLRTETVANGEPDTLCEQGYLIDRVPGEPGRFRVSPPDSALYHARRALDLGADEPDLHMLLGDVWLASGWCDRAVAEYRGVAALVAPEQRASFHDRFAQALLGAGDPEGYLAHLRRAVELDPERHAAELCQAYVKVADYHNQGGSLAKYVAYLKIAVQQCPAASDLHYRLGNGLWEMDRRAEAARHWHITLELRPDHPDRQRMLGLIKAASRP